MNLEHLTTLLTNNAETIHRLTLGITDEQARWKPAPDAWSILETVNHLYDEEREDFRVHLDYILHHLDQPWPEINPQGWVTERQYNQRRLEESISNLAAEREKSLAWLASLSSPNWQATYQAPWGQLAAGDILAAWAAHDILHMRQLVELRWALVAQLARPYQLDYAGKW